MYPPAGEGSRHRDDYNVSQEVHDHRHYYYQDSAVLQSPSSSAPDAHHYHLNRMENQMPQFNSHSEGQMLSYTAPRQYSSISSVRIPTLETSHLHPNDTYSPHSDLHVRHSPPNTYPTAPGRRPGFLSALDTSESSLHNANHGLLASASTTDASTDSDKWETPVSDSARSLTQPTRKRRTKEKIALAPDQPPTTQGKPRSRVYVACLQCRTRKIRCDGAKPTCYNCSKRAGGGSDCNYDAVPKRRGPDKNPGARQRLARDLQSDIEMDEEPRRRRRLTDTSAYQSPAESPSSTPNSAYFSGSNVGTSSLPFSEPSSPYGGHHDSVGHLSHVYSPPVLHGCLCHGADPCPVALLSPNEVYIRRTEPTEYPLPSPRAGLRSRGYIRPIYNDNEGLGEDGEIQNISQQPSSEYTR